MPVSICRCAFGCKSVTKWYVTGPQWAVGPLDLLKMDYSVHVCVCATLNSDRWAAQHWCNHSVQPMTATSRLKCTRPHRWSFTVRESGQSLQCVLCTARLHHHQSEISHTRTRLHRVINGSRQMTMSSPGRWKRVITQQLNDTSSHLYWKVMPQWVIKCSLSVTISVSRSAICLSAPVCL